MMENNPKQFSNNVKVDQCLRLSFFFNFNDGNYTGCLISFEARQNLFIRTHRTMSNHYVSISASSTRDNLSNDI
jgi:hypothetical protein